MRLIVIISATILIAFTPFLSGCATTTGSDSFSHQGEKTLISELREVRVNAKNSPSDFGLKVKKKRLEHELMSYAYSYAKELEVSLGGKYALDYIGKVVEVMPWDKGLAALQRDLQIKYLSLAEESSKEGSKSESTKKSSNKKIPNKRQRNLKPISLNVEEVGFQSILEFVCSTYGINAVFDESVKNPKMTINIESIGFDDAIDLLMSLSNTAYKVLNTKNLLFYARTKEKIKVFEEQIVKLYKVKYVNVKDISVILKTTLNLEKMTVNENQNLLIVRDNPEVLELVDALIAANDIAKSQVVLSVEILEINRNKADRIGLDLGSYDASIKMSAIPLGGSISKAIREGSTLSIPSITMSSYKQEVDAKTLASPRIRVLDGEKAKIHIGDRVPLRSSSIQDATGQTRTTFEYQEIGIRLSVEPRIKSEEFVEIKLSLEVSALGENLGTTNEPAFRIGTRNVETIMLVKDNESAILGGLIREEERHTNSGLPNASRWPIIGKMFAYNDDQAGRTDIILTITPRIIKGDEFNPGDGSGQFNVGTRARLSSEFVSPLHALTLTKPNIKFDVFSEESNNIDLVVESNKEESSSAHANAEPTQIVEKDSSLGSVDRQVPLVKTIRHDRPKVKFTSNVLRAKELTPVNTDLLVSGIESLRELEIELIYNPKMIELKGADQLQVGTHNLAHIDEEQKNKLILTFNDLHEIKLETLIVGLKVTPKKKGTSFIVMKAKGVDSEGNKIDRIQTSNSRIFVD